MSGAGLLAVTLRRLTVLDLPAITDMWVASWRQTFPEFDFEERRLWFHDRMSEHLLIGVRCLLAEHHDAVQGFITIDEKAGFVDQLAVAPQAMGRGVARQLLAEARRLSPQGLTLDVNEQNARALAFYKREGFIVTGTGTNVASGLPLLRMAWRP
jgi:putative acetyltransferase